MKKVKKVSKTIDTIKTFKISPDTEYDIEFDEDGPFDCLIQIRHFVYGISSVGITKLNLDNVIKDAEIVVATAKLTEDIEPIIKELVSTCITTRYKVKEVDGINDITTKVNHMIKNKPELWINIIGGMSAIRQMRNEEILSLNEPKWS